MKKPFVKCLELSTGHVSKQTAEALDNAIPNNSDRISAFPCRVAFSGCGWVMWPTEPDEDKRWENFPELKVINDYAYKNNCFIVNFDRDADALKEFKSFNW